MTVGGNPPDLPRPGSPDNIAAGACLRHSPPVSTTLRTLPALADAGLIEPERLPALEQVAARYAVAVTPAMAELMDDPHIARQFLPDVA